MVQHAAQQVQEIGGGSLLHGGIPVGGGGNNQLAAQDGDILGSGDGQTHPRPVHRDHPDGDILADDQGLAGFALQDQHGAPSSVLNWAREWRIS